SHVIYSISLHDALPICWDNVPSLIVKCSCFRLEMGRPMASFTVTYRRTWRLIAAAGCVDEVCPLAFSCANGTPKTRSPISEKARSEEHTSELQSRGHLV